ncbi:HutD family protein [Halomonas sp. HP20-15]|uniref:HutD/Ves family protein n=1 Tax=Halomonas sp. HP20-15 TaxID=3085901 RepID=UPI0029823894|nr:HutD family protein [Halomonas sp. HP20-15]MDW5375782.1 HutD family protein [Halomonas sp. HP20-15]
MTQPATTSPRAPRPSMDLPDTLRFAELEPVAWRNGGGVTRELARGPAHEAGPGWRVSLAELERAGPFSAFAGLARHFTVIGAHPVTLMLAGRRVELAPLESLAFAGDAAVDCLLPDGPSRALNLMYNPRHWRADVAWLDPGVALTRDPGCETLLLAVAGGARLAGSVSARLDCGDAWHWRRLGSPATPLSYTLEAPHTARLIRIDLQPLT